MTPSTDGRGAEGAGPGLSPIARADGTLSIVAMDQRNTLRRMLTAAGRPTTAEELRGFKVDVTAALSPAASAVLLDPELGVPAVAEAGALEQSSSLLVAAEPADRDEWHGEPRSRPGATLKAAAVRSMGGDAAKLLVYLRPDRPHRPGEPDLVEEVLAVVRAMVEDCAREGLPSVVETLLYPLPGEAPLDPARRAELVVESARLLDEARPDLLKLEYPGSASACRAVAGALRVPWAVLSAGMDFEPFLEALRVACDEGGASGFIAGRVYWKEAVALAGAARTSFLVTTARRRLEQSVALMEGRARPWASARRP